MKRFAVFVLLSLVGSGCSAAMSVAPTNIPFPRDVNIVSPDANVPKEIAAFSGKWYGAWYGRRTHAWMGDLMLAVEKVDSTGAVVVTGWSGNPTYNFAPGWVRLEAQFVKDQGALIGTTPQGAKLTYRMKGDVIEGSYVSSGGELYSTLARVRD